jgi:hypothetical protein
MFLRPRAKKVNLKLHVRCSYKMFLLNKTINEIISWRVKIVKIIPLNEGLF